MAYYIYLGIIALSLIIEASTTTLVAIWFIPSALVCMLLNALGINAVIQTVVFFILSGVLMALFYKKLCNIIHAKTEKTGIDTLIGKTAVAEEDISYLNAGRVKVNGMSWKAYIEKDFEEIKKGETVTVLSIDGVKLLCKKDNG